MPRNFKTKIIYFIKKYRICNIFHRNTVKKTKKVENIIIYSLYYNCLNKPDLVLGLKKRKDSIPKYLFDSWVRIISKPTTGLHGDIPYKPSLFASIQVTSFQVTLFCGIKGKKTAASKIQ